MAFKFDDRFRFEKIDPRVPGRYPIDATFLQTTQPISDIPVYRISHNEWLRERHKRNSDDLESWPLQPGQTIEDIRSSKTGRRHLEDVDPYEWEFNRVVGWLRIYAGPKKVCAELWWAERKTLRERSEPFKVRPMGLLFTLDVGDTDEETYTLLCKALDCIRSMPIFARRFIDDEKFRTFGRYARWTSIPKPE